MEREPTDADVKAAWANFRHPWDFEQCPVLRIPLNPPRSVFDLVVPTTSAKVEPMRARHAEIKIEYGMLDHQKARRLVGTIPGTDVKVILETAIVHR